MNDLIALAACYDELEKIALRFRPDPIAGILGASIIGGAGVAAARQSQLQDRMLTDMGYLRPDIARQRQLSRLKAIGGITALGATAASLGSGYAQARITRFMSEGLKKSTDEALQNAADKMDDMLRRQAEYQTRTAKRALREAVEESGEEMGKKLGRGFAGGIEEKTKNKRIGRVLFKKVKAPAEEAAGTKKRFRWFRRRRE